MTEVTLNRRLGQLKYTGTLLDQNPEALELLYSHFIPLDMRFDAAEDLYYVKGLSKAFRKVEVGERIPFYRAVFKRPAPANVTGRLELYFEEVL